MIITVTENYAPTVSYDVESLSVYAYHSQTAKFTVSDSNTEETPTISYTDAAGLASSVVTVDHAATVGE